MGTKKPYLVVSFMNLITAGMILLSKVAFNQGMNIYVFLFYRQLVGAIVLAPLSVIFERKSSPKLSLSIFCKIFMLGFLGNTFSLNIFNLALVYTTPTISSAVMNSLPVVTFLFAVLFRLENVRIKTSSGFAKVVGMITCMAGVGILAFYKGPHSKPLFHHHLFKSHSSQKHHVHPRNSWIMGCFLLLIANCGWGLWLVLQTQVLKRYPAKLTFTSLQCFSSTIQSFFVGIVMSRNLDKWKLGWNLQLLAVLYCGIMVNVVALYLQTWVLEKKGPVFNAMAIPLSLIFTTIGSVLFLGETISLGSTIGEVSLVISLYLVLWGKNKENTGTLQSPTDSEKENADQKEAEVNNTSLHHQCKVDI